MSDVKIKFWVEDPSILFTDLVFFPTAEMPREQKFNALTRLAIIISGVLYTMEYKYWLNFLLISVLTIIVLYYVSKNKKGQHAHTSESGEKEGFTMTPIRINDDFEQTIVAPLFAEEHRVLPPAYDMYENAGFEDVAFIEPLRPQAYPYGQYLTKTNFLPSDEYALQMTGSGGAKSAREFANNMFTRNDVAFRENMQRVYKKKLQRRFRNSQVEDSFSPFESY